MFPMASVDYLHASVSRPEDTPEFEKLYGEPSPEQYESWEDARTECARLAWEPYMHNPSLPALLRGIDGPSTLVMWGDDDRILPEDPVRTYASSIRGARLRTFENVGHRPEIECAGEFLQELNEFLN
jgi:pimeloyl-ACP methyl ester carboxylesterase